MTTGRQLGLPFAFEPSLQAADFLAAPSNAEARAWLAAAWPGGRLALWGDEGTGKTHLLHIWARDAGAATLHGPGLRAGHARPGALAIDDADMADEAILLHVLNAAAEAGHPVLLTAREPPARWGTILADLASRLRATAAVQLGRPDEALLRALFARLLSERQCVVPQPVQGWLLARLPRTAAAIREAAARLDRLALASGGPVTRALASQLCEDGLREYGEVLADTERPSPPGAILL